MVKPLRLNHHIYNKQYSIAAHISISPDKSALKRTMYLYKAYLSYLFWILVMLCCFERFYLSYDTTYGKHVLYVLSKNSCLTALNLGC